MITNDLDNVYLKKLLELFNSLGISKDKCMNLLEAFNKRYSYNVETFYKKNVELVNYLSELGIEKVEIGHIISRFIPVFSYKLDLLNSNLKHLLSLGFSKEDIKKMIILAPNVLAFKNKVDESFNYFLSLGYTKEEVIGMVKKSPTLLSRSSNYIKNRLDLYKSFGMSEEDALKVFKRTPTLLLFTNDTLYNKINDLIDIGFKREAIYSILRINSAILGYTKESIIERINLLSELGFTKEEAIRLYSHQRTLFSMSPDKIKDKIKTIKECDYQDDNVKDIVKRYPGIVTLSSESIKEKLSFYSSLGLHSILVKEPKHLMQSLTLSKARNSFLEAKGLKVNESNYRRLFMGEKVFVKQFNKTNEEVVEEYSLKLKR